jgi:hypothetical protein
LRLHLSFHPLSRALAVSCLLASVILSFTQAQQAPQKPPSAKASAPTESKNPAQIELLETRYRFEANGDSHKEVHAHVHINTELGVRQFARLNFDYNRSFETVEIPLVRITHPSGGTADILPSAITDNPNPAVINAPAYQDVRVKSVRILGLAPGDNLEYRVITTVSHHPLAPDFWLDHSFDRTGVVSNEIFDLDLPALPRPKIQINPVMPATTIENSGHGDAGRSIYRWRRAVALDKFDDEVKARTPDVIVTTFADWESLSVRLAESLQPRYALSESPIRLPEIVQQAKALSQDVRSLREKIETIYGFVSEKVSTIDLPLGSTGFAGRPPADILASRYATAEDKFVLFDALARAVADDGGGGSRLFAGAELAGTEQGIADEPARPAPFTHLLIGMAFGEDNSVYWLDPSLEVAPFNMLASSYRGKAAFFIARKVRKGDVVAQPWQTIPDKLPFAASQNVSIDASIGADGKLAAKVHYSLRGDNELLLRIGFHQTPKNKWKELAQLLSLTDGFRGQVTSINVSDPYATHEPFTVDYEITQPKFVDWSKKAVRIPALLPQLGLPDPPAKPAAGAAASPIELGTPLEVETQMTLHLPPGTTPHTPTGTSVQRDYATFASQYSAKGLTITASRHINFLLRHVPADRAADYNAFLRAVLNDEAQDFTLDHESPAPSTPDTKPAPSPATPRPTTKP